VEHARREVRVALRDRDGRVAKHVAHHLETPRLAPPPRDERARAGVTEIVPAHGPCIVALRGVVQLRSGEDVLPAAGDLALLTPAAALGREDELVRVLGGVAREDAEPLLHGGKADAEQRDASGAAVLWWLALRAPANEE